MAVSSSKIVDLSFAGSKIRIGGDLIEDFVDDANPVEFAECECATIIYSCSGKMTRIAKPSAIMMSVTVIPGSPSDQRLSARWRRALVNQNSTGVTDDAIDANVSFGNPTMRGVSLKKGTIVSGPGGPNVSGTGKMNGKTYTFAFAMAE